LRENLIYAWFFAAFFATVAAVVTPEEMAIFVAFFIAFAIPVMLLEKRMRSRQAKSSKKIELSKRQLKTLRFLEKLLNYKVVRLAIGITTAPLIPLQILGCRIFRRDYKYRFGDLSVWMVGGKYRQMHTAIYVFPSAVVMTVAMLVFTLAPPAR
jgi:hypothetical protein